MNSSDRDVRTVALEGGINFRDLGGYQGVAGRRTRWHCLFRSGTTHLLTPSDRKRLAEIGIRAVVDLRSNKERQEHPHGLMGQHNILYWANDYDHVGGNILQMLSDPHLDAAHLRDLMIELYRELPYVFSDAYRHLFHQATSGPLPLVFNCAAGKDRTGVAAALLLCALGVAWEDIVADYLLTEKFVPDILRIFRCSQMDTMSRRLSAHVVAPLFGADRAYLEAMREAITVRSGSIEEYFVSTLFLTGDMVDALRRRLLV